SKGYVRGREVAMTARIGRAGTFESEGNHARATDEAEALAREQNLSPVSVYDIACLFARSSASAERDPKLSPEDRTRVKARYAEGAMSFLRDAVPKENDHPLEIKTDPDLNPVQARKDFQKLIAELETKKKLSASPPPDH